MSTALAKNPRSKPFARRPFRGLTLLELMVVLAIVAILSSIAVPSFVGLMQSNRIASEVNSLAGDLQFARAEAIKRGQSVSACVSTDGLACAANSTAWNSGWLIFSDPNGDATVSSGDERLRVQKAWTNADTFSADNSISAITYSRDGFAIGLPGSVTLTLHTSPANNNATRCLSVNIAGRQVVQAAGTANCS